MCSLRISIFGYVVIPVVNSYFRTCSYIHTLLQFQVSTFSIMKKIKYKTFDCIRGSLHL